MATGYFERGICFSLQQEAVDTHFQNIPPSILNSSTTNYISQYVRQSTGLWVLNKQTVSSTGVITNNYSISVASPIFSSCELPNDPTSNFLNGMELGWAVAGVMIVVFCIRRTYRGF